MKNTNVKTQEKNLVGNSPVSESRALLPPFLMKIMNPVMALILRSPIHWVASKQIMLLSFKGRKTGKRYSIPVGYVRKNNELTVFTHARWWRNLRGGAPVTVRIQGHEYSGVAETVDKYETVKRMVRDLMEKNGEKCRGGWASGLRTKILPPMCYARQRKGLPLFALS
jgi:hypothetical protein